MEPSESLFNEILSEGPSRKTLFLVLSRMKQEGLFERVIDACTKALEIHPDDIRIRRLLAEACFEAGKITLAESEIKAVIGKINELMTCYRFLADIFISQGKTTEAVEALKLYLIHCPDDKESYALLESLQPREETPAETALTPSDPGEEVVESFTQPLEADLPDIVTSTLAEVYFNQDKTKEAIETYEKVIKQNPEDSRSRLRLDELKAMMKQAVVLDDKEKDLVMRKKKMVSILESWLEGIREQSKTDSLSVN